VREYAHAVKMSESRGNVTATQCTTRCTTLLHTASHTATPQAVKMLKVRSNVITIHLHNTLQHTATHCNTLQQTATPQAVRMSESRGTVTQTHTPTHCNLPQFAVPHTATPQAVKMSKSRGNVVNPDDIIAGTGADALRLYLMFMGPLEQVLQCVAVCCTTI